jgi:AmmeMemoRadiSam system protein A/AmmeMemoRadiSam system protein B
MPHPPIIHPEIGKGEERKIQKTIDACREVARRIAALRPDTIVLTSPHSVMYADYFHISPGETAHGDFSQFGFKQVKMSVRYDDDFVKLLSDKADEAEIDAGTMGQRSAVLDHGTMIPLSFVDKEYADYRLVRIGLSGLPPLTHYRFGQLISRTAEELNRNVVFLASGDLSHKLADDGPYGFAAEGPQFDEQVTEAMAKGDFLRFLTFDADFCENAAECGLRSFMIMAGALDRKAVQAQLLSYEGPFGVGYGVAAFSVTGEDPTRNFGEQYERLLSDKMAAIKEAEDPYVRLARLSVETYVRTGCRASLPDGLPQAMLETRAGVFVSLKKNDMLRGCIGTILPTTSCVAKEILRNAVSACSEDPRFEDVRTDELDSLIYDVDVLGQPEDIADKSQLDVKRYGVIVSHGTQRGLLLPDLAGVNSVEQQIDIARQKAGIGRNEEITLQRFEVVRHL